jgi:hypothetical protein
LLFQVPRSGYPPLNSASGFSNRQHHHLANNEGFVYPDKIIARSVSSETGIPFTALPGMNFHYQVGKVNAHILFLVVYSE